MAKKSPDHVSISFHFMTRKAEDNTPIKITADEFTNIYVGLEKNKNLDHADPSFIEIVKMQDLALIKRLERINGRTICGVYENSYWGHSFRNSDKGEIDANSVNFRRFFFLLYLSESGRVYIGSQYLGNYGGYTALKNTVARSLEDRQNLAYNSINLFAAQMDKLIPTEVIFNVARQPKTAVGRNSFSKRVVVALKDGDKTGEYERGVKQQILSLFNNTPEQIRRGLTKFLSQQELIMVNESELENCKVIATVNKRTITVNMLDGNNFATKINLDVRLNKNGHPEYDPVKTEALHLLQQKIIMRTEDV